MLCYNKHAALWIFGFSFQSFEHKNTITIYVLNLITEAFSPNLTKAFLGEGYRLVSPQWMKITKFQFLTQNDPDFFLGGGGIFRF